MSPRLRSVLARVVLVGGIASVGAYLSRSAPHDQSIAVRLAGHDVARVSGVVTRLGDEEPTAGFSQDFSATSPPPRVVRHGFSAPNGTYIVVINCTERVGSGEVPWSETEGKTEGKTEGAAERPKLIETSFERRVSLAGGEVIVSPD